MADGTAADTGTFTFTAPWELGWLKTSGSSGIETSGSTFASATADCVSPSLDPAYIDDMLLVFSTGESSTDGSLTNPSGHTQDLQLGSTSFFGALRTMYTISHLALTTDAATGTTTAVAGGGVSSGDRRGLAVLLKSSPPTAAGGWLLGA